MDGFSAKIAKVLGLYCSQNSDTPFFLMKGISTNNRHLPAACIDAVNLELL